MGNLLAVKERQNTTDTMFEPLQQTIALLKEYEQELPDVVYKQLEVRSDVQSSPIIFKPRLFSLFLPTETEQFFFLFLCFFKSVSCTSSWQSIICQSCPPRFSPPLCIYLCICLSVCRSCQTSGTMWKSRQCWSSSRWHHCRLSRCPVFVESVLLLMLSNTHSGSTFAKASSSGRKSLLCITWWSEIMCLITHEEMSKCFACLKLTWKRKIELSNFTKNKTKPKNVEIIFVFWCSLL